MDKSSVIVLLQILNRQPILVTSIVLNVDKSSGLRLIDPKKNKIHIANTTCIKCGEIQWSKTVTILKHVNHIYDIICIKYNKIIIYYFNQLTVILL